MANDYTKQNEPKDIINARGDTETLKTFAS